MKSKLTNLLKDTILSFAKHKISLGFLGGICTMVWLDSHTLDLSHLLGEFNLWHAQAFPTTTSLPYNIWTSILDDMWKTRANPLSEAWHAHGWLPSKSHPSPITYPLNVVGSVIHDYHQFMAGGIIALNDGDEYQDFVKTNRQPGTLFHDKHEWYFLPANNLWIIDPPCTNNVK
jgi:hypothetical protein